MMNLTEVLNVLCKNKDRLSKLRITPIPTWQETLVEFTIRGKEVLMSFADRRFEDGFFAKLASVKILNTGKFEKETAYLPIRGEIVPVVIKKPLPHDAERCTVDHVEFSREGADRNIRVANVARSIATMEEPQIPIGSVSKEVIVDRKPAPERIPTFKVFKF